MKPSPLVSIVIPAWNSERWLPETVQSAVAQSYGNWEMVIVNDGSSDSTLQVANHLAAGDSRIRVMSRENGGFCAARNTGFEHTDPASSYIIFLDADDLWEPDMLEHLVVLLEDNPQPFAAYGLCRYIDELGNFIKVGELEEFERARWGVENGKPSLWPPERPTSFEVMAVYGPIVTVGCVLHRRTSLQSNNLFDESLGAFEDWDLWLRLCESGSMLFSDRHVLRYRSHDSNHSKNGATDKKYETITRMRLLQRFPANTEKGRIVRVGARVHHRNHAKRYWREACNHLRKNQWLEGSADFLRSLRQRVAGLAFLCLY